MEPRTTTLGILGTDPRTAEVVTAALRRGWRSFQAADPGAAPSPGFEPWTTLLDAEACAAVVVGADGWNPARADAVRTLVQAGRPLVLAQPLELAMLWAYELDMIARDSGARLVPVLPDRLHPSIAALRAKLDVPTGAIGSLGPVESLRLERCMSDRSRDAVLAALSRDVDLVRALAGDPERLATLGAGDAENAWPSLAVGFAWQSRIPARWQVVAGSEPGLRITLHHARGSLEVFAPDGSGPWTSSPPLPPPACFDRGAAIVEHLASVLGGVIPPPTAIPAATWSDAARALEIADTVPRSLAKGRAIDLHREEFSDVGTFKGTMASLGCGMLLVIPVLLVVAPLVAGAVARLEWEPATAVANAWPAMVLVALVGFLLIQVLPLIMGPARAPTDAPGTGAPGAGGPPPGGPG